MKRAQLELALRQSLPSRTLGFVLLWLCVGGAFDVEAASKSADDKPPIPPDLFFESRPIPNEDNAIYFWRGAANTMVKPDDQISEAISYAWKPEAVSPSDEDHDAIRNWLDQNRDALRLVETSLKKSASKWLATKGEELQPELWTMGYMTKARIASSDRLAAQGKWDEAAGLLEGNLRLSQLAIESEAALIHYLVGGHARTTTHRAILRLANHRATPVKTLRRLLAALPSLDSETNTYANLLRVEFTIYEYPGVDIKWFAEAWSKPEARNIISLTYDDKYQRPFMVLTDPGLVARHPKPFDQAAELERAAETCRRFRTNAFSLWTNRVDADEEPVEKIRTDLLEEIEPLMNLVSDEPLPLSQRAIAKARSAYLAIADPIGRIIQCKNSLLSGDAARVFRNRTEREAVRAVLAAIIFERQKEQLPDSLDDLVEGKIIQRIPWDHFANAPLKYSKTQRLIWSVGEDAEDDNGEGSTDAPWSDVDAVWRIPTRIK